MLKTLKKRMLVNNNFLSQLMKVKVKQQRKRIGWRN